jgi:hypothetical protein
MASGRRSEICYPSNVTAVSPHRGLIPHRGPGSTHRAPSSTAVGSSVCFAGASAVLPDQISLIKKYPYCHPSLQSPPGNGDRGFCLRDRLVRAPKPMYLCTRVMAQNYTPILRYRSDITCSCYVCQKEDFHSAPIIVDDIQGPEW